MTESPEICGTTIVFASTSVYRSPIVVGLLNGGWTEYGLSNAVVDDVPDVVVWSHPAWLLVMGRGPSVGRGGGGLE